MITVLKKYRKIIIIAVFAVALAAAGFFIKNYLDAKNDPSQPAEALLDNPTSTAALPDANADEASKPVLKKISEQPVFDFFSISSSTEEMIYVTPAGEVFRASDNEDDRLSQQTFNALNSIAPSPDGRKILAAFGDPSQPQWLIFDLAEKVWRPIPNTISQAVWGNDDKEIIAVSRQNLIRLKINQNAFTEEVLWRNFSFQDVNLIFLPPQTVLIAEKPAFFHEGRAWEFNFKTAELSAVFGPAPGLFIRQATDRSTILKFDDIDDLSIINRGRIIHYETLPSKCEMSQGIPYCFLPLGRPDGINWPDDYFQKNFYTEDQLFIFDEQGARLIDLETSEKIDGLKPIRRQNALYFINRRDNSLYRLSPLDQPAAAPLSD